MKVLDVILDLLKSKQDIAMFIYADNTLTNLDQVVQISPYINEAADEYAVAIRDVQDKITYLPAFDEKHMEKIISVIAGRTKTLNLEKLIGIK